MVRIVNHVLISVFGSLGDVAPQIQVGRALRKIGCSVRIATHPEFETIVTAAGLGFMALQPALSALDQNSGWNKAFVGDSFLRDHLLPHARKNLSALLATDFDLLVSSSLSIVGPMAAKIRSKPWISTATSPLGMYSRFDIFETPPAPTPRSFMKLGRAFSTIGEEFGLKTQRKNPLLRGQFSPRATWALFPAFFGPKQKDWPDRSLQLGFPLWGSTEKKFALPAGFQDFVCVAMGTAEAIYSETELDQLLSKFEQLPDRLVFISAKKAALLRARFKGNSRIYIAERAAFRDIFSRSKAVIHTGSTGATADALAAGRSSLAFPVGFDQFDNAQRCQAKNWGHSFDFLKFTADELIHAVKRSQNATALRALEKAKNEIESNDFAAQVESAFEKSR